MFLLASVGCLDESPTRPTQKGPSSSSTVFQHIRTFEIGNDAYDQTETDFIASHFDVFVGTGVQVPRIYEVNPDIALLAYITIRANSPESFGPSCPLGDLCADTFCSNHGYDVEDCFLHYREDVSYDYNFPDGGLQTVSVPGWNPDWQPGDPPASATEKSESRVWGRWTPEQRWANVASRAWQHWRNESIAGSMQKDGRVVEGVLIDGVVRLTGEMSYMMFDKTLEYTDETVDINFRAIDDCYAYIPVLRDHLAHEFGESKILLGNAEAGYYLIEELTNSSRLAERFDWFLVENGVRFDAFVSAQTCSYDIQFQHVLGIRDLAESGKKILFGGKDNSDTERGRIFTLATFYLINGPNLYFCDHKIGIHWFDAIGYDIGEPLGDAYLRASGPDPARPASTYYLMAREYTNALVLVKFRDSASYFMYFGSETTHSLGGTYQPLGEDGTLGGPVTEVTLFNNEAAILIPQ
jgi:hypothetical protein